MYTSLRVAKVLLSNLYILCTFLLKTRLFEIILHYERVQISWIKMFGMQFSYATTIYPHMLTWYLSEIDCAILDKERTKKNQFCFNNYLF